ncbi:MAG: hypothetical protein ACK48P_03405 [Holosporales bacterium]
MVCVHSKDPAQPHPERLGCQRHPPTSPDSSSTPGSPPSATAGGGEM